MWSLPRGLLSCVLALGLVASAEAYNLFGPYSWGEGVYYQKWGDIFSPGSPGGTITWSLMPDGTTINPSAPYGIPSYMHGTSDLTSVFNKVGGQAAAVAMIQSALDNWSAAANIYFEYVGVDDGTPFGATRAPGQVIGDIRIGAFEIDGFSAGNGFSAYPPGDNTLDGDIILNSRSDISYYVAPGNEGDLYDLYPPGGGLYRNDFEGLVAHELGHALALDHSDVPSGLMCGNIGECAYFDPDGDNKAPINRIPDADDVAGVQFLYGPALLADFDHNNTVNGSDLALWQAGYGTAVGATYQNGDADGDDGVTGRDFVIWQREFGKGAIVPLSAVAAVPEPGCLALGVIGLLYFTSRHRMLNVPS
jgi:hypothetical protein